MKLIDFETFSFFKRKWNFILLKAQHKQKNIQNLGHWSHFYMKAVRKLAG